MAPSNPHNPASFQKSNWSYSCSGMLWGLLFHQPRLHEPTAKTHFLMPLQGVRSPMGSPGLYPSTVPLRMPAEGQWVPVWIAKGKKKACFSPVLVSTKIIIHFLLFGWQGYKDQPKRWHINAVHQMSHQNGNIHLFEETCVDRIHPM